MKTFTTSATLILLASLAANAAPAPALAQIKPRQGPNRIAATFFGAGPNPPSYVELIPTTGTVFPISNPLSVSHITLDDTATCNFFGVDGSETTISNTVGSTTADVGPPQAQVSAVCVVGL